MSRTTITMDDLKPYVDSLGKEVYDAAVEAAKVASERYLADKLFDALRRECKDLVDAGDKMLKAKRVFTGRADAMDTAKAWLKCPKPVSERIYSDAQIADMNWLANQILANDGGDLVSITRVSEPIIREKLEPDKVQIFAFHSALRAAYPWIEDLGPGWYHHKNNSALVDYTSTASLRVRFWQDRNGRQCMIDAIRLPCKKI